MKKFYLLTLLLLGFTSVITVTAQNVFNPNDPDVIFTSTNRPAVPAYGTIAKWGHSIRLTNWGGTGTTTFKSYYYNGMAFRIKFPKTYGTDPTKKYPIFIFFHGAGEKGDVYDNEYQLYWGGQRFRDAVDNGTFDGFLFYEQSNNGYHANYFNFVTNMIDSLTKYCNVDDNRVIVNGLSSGGQGVWEFASAKPKYAAYGLPISAARSEYIPNMPNYVHIPIWIFNGGTDNNPDPATATQVINAFKNAGGNIKQTFYPTLGHGVWDNAWNDPGFMPILNSAYKSDPLVYFQKTNFCPGDPISAQIGITAGFYAYEWRKDGSALPNTTNNITVSQLGSYSVRFKRTASSPWSDWSHKPAVLTSGAVTATPPIQIDGLNSNVLPAPNDSARVPLEQPEGYAAYKWIRVSDNAVVSTSRIFYATPGTYVAQVTAQFACSSTPSSPFTVINANGPNKPDAAKNLLATPLSQTTMQLSWSKNPNVSIPETGFEIYRATTAGGPYTLITITAANVTSFGDANLSPNTNYYYIVRAINNSAAAANTNEATAKTLIDNKPPTAPGDLGVTGSSRNSVSLQWTPSTDDVGVAFYDIYVNGSKAYTTPATSNTFTVYNLTYNTTYAFKVVARDVVGNLSPASNQVLGTAVAKGLNYSYYEGTWTNLPNFSALTPVKTGSAPNINLNVRNRNENYAVSWSGFINIRTAGTYIFETVSDDGSKLFLNNSTTALVNNDGAHGSQSRTGTVTLAKGVYPITVTYFQGGGGYELGVYWRNTGAGIARALIPDSAFVESVTLGGTAPNAPSAVTATALSYNKIRLNWTDNSSNETGFEIYRATSTSGPFTIVATTGAGTTTYTDSTVAASTLYYYKIRSIGQYGQSDYDAIGQGASYAYYEGTGLSVLPNFATLTPVKTGLWPNFTLGMQNRANDFQVKFDSYITITTAGTYTFYTSSDDGSALYINTTRVVNNDGLHGTQEASGTISLTPGVYPISVRFFQVGGGSALTASYSGPGGITKQAIPTNRLGKPFASATTMSLPGLPQAPTSLVATTKGISTIGLTWTDNTNDATGFKIYRSAADSNSYQLIATLSNVTGTSFTYDDASLFENVLYYYKVKATNVTGDGNFSTYDTAKTSVTSPVINPIADFTMRYGTQSSVGIVSSISAGLTINLSVSGLPAFASFTDNHDGTGSIVFNPSISDQNTYPFVVTATGSNGGVSNEPFTLTVNSNNVPVLGAISNVTYNEGSSNSILLSATDDDGLTGLVFSSPNLPSFGSIVNNGDGTANLLLNPTFISAGSYIINLLVTDPQNGVSTKSFTVTVNDKTPGQKIFVRIKFQQTAPAPWNNMTGPSISNLVAEDGTVTGVGVGFTPGFWQPFDVANATGNNSGVYPDVILREANWFGIYGAPEVVTTTITGLSPTTKYNFRFFAGSNYSGLDNGSTVFTIGGQSLTLLVQQNKTNTADFSNITPDASGNVVVTMSKASGSVIGYINAIEITSQYDDQTAPAPPVNLTAQLLPAGSIKLNWTNVAYNAQRYSIYRATDTTAAFTLLNPGANNGTATTYTDATTNGHTTYYYKIKAENNYGDLGYTNIVSATTDAQIPVITGVSSISASVGVTTNLNFTVSGDPNSTITVTSVLPSFATLQNLGSGNYRIVVNPSGNNIGSYNASVTAKDSYGSTVTSQFQVYVIENLLTSVFVHFGQDTAIAQLPWNNFLGYPFANRTMSNLQRADGTNSGMSLTLVDQWSAAPVDFGMTSGNNTGLFPDVVMRSSLFETSSNARNIRLSGLDPNKYYNVVFFSGANNGQKALATYRSGAQSVTLDASYNENKTVQLNGLRSDASGNLVVTYQKDAASAYGYLNAIIIQSYSKTDLPIVSPNFVLTEPLFNSRTSLKVSWSDRADNETAYEVWRSGTLNGTYSLVGTLGANLGTFTNTGLTANTQYFYKIRAINASTQSAYSNIVSGTTPSSIILEHTTWTYPTPIAPWNNTAINPQVGDRYANLKDDQLNNTGVALNLLAAFGGELNNGLTSGNNSYVFPDNVMYSNFWVQNASQVAVMKFDGLDQTKKYRIGFEGSSVWTIDMTGYMTINGVTKFLNASNNTSKVVYFDNISPDGNGEIQLSFGAKGQYGVLGAIVLMGYTDYSSSASSTSVSETTLNNARIMNNSTSVELTTAIEEQVHNFGAYPNPFSDGFNVTFDAKGGKKTEIEIYNISGQLQYRENLGTSREGVNSFNVHSGQAGLPVGMYIARIKQDGESVKTFKIMKRK